MKHRPRSPYREERGFSSVSDKVFHLLEADSRERTSRASSGPDGAYFYRSRCDEPEERVRGRWGMPPTRDISVRTCVYIYVANDRETREREREKREEERERKEREREKERRASSAPMKNPAFPDERRYLCVPSRARPASYDDDPVTRDSTRPREFYAGRSA